MHVTGIANPGYPERANIDGTFSDTNDKNICIPEIVIEPSATLSDVVHTTKRTDAVLVERSPFAMVNLLYFPGDLSMISREKSNKTS